MHRPQQNEAGMVENHDKEELLGQLYEMPDGSQKSLECLTSRDIYNIFLCKKDPPDLSKTYWENKFSPRDINWESWVRYNFENRLIPRNVLDFNFRAKNNLINVETRLQRMNYSDGQCKLCALAQISGDRNPIQPETTR